jgi:hypothetical protein
MDGRVKPGHDVLVLLNQAFTASAAAVSDE